MNELGLIKEIRDYIIIMIIIMVLMIRALRFPVIVRKVFGVIFLFSFFRI